MGPAVVAKVLGRLGRVVAQGVAGLNLAVQQAKRVPLQAFLAVWAQLFIVTGIVFLQFGNVRRTAFGVADAVD